MAVQDILIPDIGDAEDVEVVEICVAVGDEVAVDGPLIVIESDKASMEVPSPVAGKIARIDVAIGDKVSEGQLIIGIEVAASKAAAAQSPPKKEQSKPKKEQPQQVDEPAPREAKKPAAAERTDPGAATRTSSPAPKKAAAHESPRTSRRVEVRLPEVGDAEEIVVVEIAVTAGGRVEKDDLLLVVESDKASMEIPAPLSGVVVEVAVAEGSKVAEGALLVVIEAAADAEVEESAPDDEAPAAAPSDEVSEPPTSAVPSSARSSSAPSSSAPSSSAPSSSATPRQATSAGPTDQVSTPGSKIYAGPAVRRQARELGVDLTLVAGTGARGRIVKDDVQSFVKRALTGPSAGKGAKGGAGIPPMPVVDFAKFGAIESVPLSRIRRRGAENLHRSWLNVVHVTQHDEADVTDLEAFRAQLKTDAATKGVKVTPLAFIMKAVAAMLKEFPQFNSSLDAGIENLVLKGYINIGFAVDTPDGLVVPVVKGADQKGIVALAEAIDALSSKARDGKLAPGDMSGGTFSISSLGPIGGTAFTPIVNAPEVAILGVSKLATKPHWTGSAFEPRQFLPLSLSYDHRAINGAEAGRFVTALCAALADMRRVLL